MRKQVGMQEGWGGCGGGGGKEVRESRGMGPNRDGDSLFG